MKDLKMRRVKYMGSKIKRTIAILLAICFLVSLSATAVSGITLTVRGYFDNPEYKRGYDDGYKDGYDVGLKYCKQNYGQTFELVEKDASDYDKGYTSGYNAGFKAGYEAAGCGSKRTVKLSKLSQDNIAKYRLERAQEYDRGYNNGYKNGYEVGLKYCKQNYGPVVQLVEKDASDYAKGSAAGYNAGFKDGYKAAGCRS